MLAYLDLAILICPAAKKVFSLHMHPHSELSSSLLYPHTSSISSTTALAVQLCLSVFLPLF